MGMANRVRKIGTITGGSNITRGLDLPRKDLLRELWLRFEGVDTITTLGSPVSFINAPFTALKRLELIADGKDTIKSISGTGLMMKNFFHFGRYPDRGPIAAWSAAACSYFGALVLPLAIPRSVREIDTVLDTGRLSVLELRATFGAHTDLFSTQPTTHANTSMVIEVHAHEAINLTGKPLALGVFKELTIEKQVTATASEFQIPLPVGNIYRGFMIETEVDGNPKDSVINSLQIRSGTTVFWQGEYPDIQNFTRTKIACPYYFQGSTTCIPTSGYGYPPGYLYIDFCPEGRLTDALNAMNLSSLELVCNVTLDGTTDYIRVYPDELVLPRR